MSNPNPEPAAEALLLTQIAPLAACAPAAGSLQSACDAARRAYLDERRAERPDFGQAGLYRANIKDNAGIIALGFFGVSLIAFGATMLLAGRGDVVDVSAGAAIATPGLAALLMAGWGFWRALQVKAVKI